MTTRRRSAKSSHAEPAAPAAEPSRWAELEGRLGYTFRRPQLLELALTHRSFPYEGGQTVPVPGALRGSRQPLVCTCAFSTGTDNEQLEFLGDAVLGLAVTEALFAEFHQCGEGELTRLRASLVSRKRMAELGEQLGLGEYLRLGRSADLNGIRRKPTVLANTAEAVIAAIYLDSRAAGDAPESSHTLDPVRELVERCLLGPERQHLREELASAGGGRALLDHKTLLQERVQASSAGRLRYVDIAETGPPHQRRFVVEAQLEDGGTVRVLASAEGASKKEAQQRAAALALEHLSTGLQEGAR
jgi:ribonuclease-3